MVDVTAMFAAVVSSFLRTPILVMTLVVIAAAALIRLTYKIMVKGGE